MKRSMSRVYGLIAQFETPEDLVSAVARSRAKGYRQMDTYSPFPIDEMPDALGLKSSRVPLVALIGGLIGAGSAYMILWYSAVIAYPWNIGGRPLHSWPSFIPITFELGVLGAATFIFVTILIFNRLPKPYHPVFNAACFDRATTDRFYLCIEATDPNYQDGSTRQFLQTLGPEKIEEVAW